MCPPPDRYIVKSAQDSTIQNWPLYYMLRKVKGALQIKCYVSACHFVAMQEDCLHALYIQ